MLYLVASLLLAAADPGPKPIEPCRTVHGRMFLASGTPSVRIWIVGTRRILGVVQQDESFDYLPANIRKAWAGRDGVADETLVLYGDYEVCPLTRSKLGAMQSVYVRTGKRLVAKPIP